ncbi:hypothetical protein [Sulfitobacter pontiacus]|nr:hypothetical protein [Sulfitobacter pontiacus]
MTYMPPDDEEEKKRRDKRVEPESAMFLVAVLTLWIAAMLVAAGLLV